MPTIFTKILNKEIPGEIIWEDEDHATFLSIEPISQGHTLVIPRREVDHWLDLTQDEFMKLNQAVYHVADFLKKTFDCQRIGQMISGFEVPHVHVHLIPADTVRDFPFPPVQSATPKELAQVAEKIREFV